MLSSKVKLVVLVTLLATVTVCIIYRSPLLSLATSYLSWVQDNPVSGAFSYVIVYALATVLLLPGTPLTLGAGLVFTMALSSTVYGIALGSLVVFFGATLGATLAFLLSGALLRAQVEKLLVNYPKFQAVDSVLNQQGLKTVFLLRLSPLLPFNVFNYLMATTSVSFTSYFLGCLGLLPGTIAYVALGATLGSISQVDQQVDGGSTGLLIYAVVGTVLALAVSVYVGVLAKREINRMVEQQPNKHVALLPRVSDSC